MNRLRKKINWPIEVQEEFDAYLTERKYIVKSVKYGRTCYFAENNESKLLTVLFCFFCLLMRNDLHWFTLRKMIESHIANNPEACIDYKYFKKIDKNNVEDYNKYIILLNSILCIQIKKSGGHK